MLEREKQSRKKVLIEPERVSDVSSTDFPGTYPGVDDSFDLEAFKQNCRVEIKRLNEQELQFDLIGVDASLANAFRRILIAEVPTVAIENVYIHNNTSVIQDEILAQRLGLIPIKVDPRLMQWRIEGPTDMNTLVFHLQVKCEKNKEAPRDATNPDQLYINSNVYSGHLVWVPQGDQVARLGTVKPVHDKILIAKLRPGQEIIAELHAEKDIGREHAKWSPVATASYRLMPDIQILKEITGEMAERFVSCFPPGVAELYDEDGVQKARVVNPRLDTVSREVLRHKDLAERTRLTRIRDHFIFSVESVGILPPDVLFLESIKVLMDKTRVLKDALEKLGSHDTE